MVKINRYLKNKGFTLLELLIVVIIVGILASLALPRFLRAAEKARWAEARSICGVVRSGQMRRIVETGNYTAILTDLDVQVPVAGTFFNFAANNPGVAGGVVATATRNGVQDGAGLAGESITITDAGVWAYSGGVPTWLQ